MDTEEIRRALNGYYNLCMDEFNGHAKEEAIDMFMDKAYPWEKVAQRKGEMISKHPHIKDMLMKDSLVKSWIDSWSRTELSIEEGLAQLALFLQRNKSELEKQLKKEIEMSKSPRIW